MTPIAERDRRIADHVDTARRIARRIARRCPAWVQDDLIAAGMLGLAEAAERYDDRRGEPFLAFATKRIRGAVLDELRRGDIMPRRVRTLARKVGAIMQALEAQLGQRPEDQSMAAALRVSIDHYRTELKPLADVRVGSLEDLEHAPPAAPAEQSPAHHAERNEMLAQISAALERLDARDVLILSLHYGDELNCGEIGQVIGVSTSRVCQLHSRALARLRVELERAPTAARQAA